MRRVKAKPENYEAICLRCPFEDDCHEKDKRCPAPKDSSGKPRAYEPMIQHTCGVPDFAIIGVTIRV